MRSAVRGARALEEAVVSAEGIEGIVLRYGSFYGDGTWFARDGSQAKMLRARRFPIVGKGTGVWSWIHIEDAADATIAAILRGRRGVYNVVDDAPVAAREWIPDMAKALGAPPPMRVPAFLARILAGAPAMHAMLRQAGASNAKAKRELDWQPRHPTWREGFPAALTSS
jgi:nucleoside-diphosphate-sugar epimerase